MVWLSLVQPMGVLLIIIAALLLPEPKYVDYPRLGTWTPEKSLAAFNNKVIYARRFIRRGVGVGIVFGLMAGALAAFVNAIH